MTRSSNWGSDNLEGWDQVGGGTYVYLWLIHVDVWQKLTQYYKAIILQLKKKQQKQTNKQKKNLPTNAGDTGSILGPGRTYRL